MLDNFEVDLTEFKSDAELESARGVPPGKYHAAYVNVTEDMQSQKRLLLLKFQILAGTNAEGVGLVHTERLYATDKSRQRLALFLRRLGLIRQEDLGRPVSVDWNTGLGKHVVIEIIEEEYETIDKKTGATVKHKSSKISFAGIWDVNDERVVGVPKDTAAIKAGPMRPVQSAAVVGSNHTATVGVRLGSNDDFSDL